MQTTIFELDSTCPAAQVWMRGVKPRSLLLSCCIILRESNALSTTNARSLRLCAFRGRSRHTSGFEPFETFELAPQEFIASAQPTGLEEHDIHLKPTRGSSVFQWIHSSMGDAELAEAASRCVLLHGLFEVWGHGRNQEEAAKDASRSGRFLHSVDASWSVGVTSYGRSNLKKVEQQAIAGGSVEEFLSTSLNGRRTESLNSDIRIRIIEDTCPPPAVNLPPDVRERAEAEAAAAGKSRENRFYICRELQVGAAVSEGGTAMSTSCGRRPIRGVLGALALNLRRCCGPTAIEPEVAIVMANLAKVRLGSLILDPFCGSCSLLLPAASMGAEVWGSDVAGPATVAPLHTVGQAREQLDDAMAAGCKTNEQADREGLNNMYQDFGELGLAPPTLVAADVSNEESRVRRPEFYDAIITDPPYNIKVKVITNTDARSREKINPTILSRGTEEASTGSESRSSAFPVARPDSMVGFQQMQQKEADEGGGGGCADYKGTEWKAGDGARAEACANDLVGEVVWSLLSLARYSLKPGGRLCFFLPLRGAEARLVSLPTALLEGLSAGDNDAGGAGANRLLAVYATKQRMTSPNMCRWLVVMEKERQ